MFDCMCNIQKFIGMCVRFPPVGETGPCSPLFIINPYPANVENRVSSQILPANSGLADGMFL